MSVVSPAHLGVARRPHSSSISAMTTFSMCKLATGFKWGTRGLQFNQQSSLRLLDRPRLPSRRRYLPPAVGDGRPN
ncbi:hypothetical protein K0C01_08610 [Salinarchaeum sp. IM2453]|uniref:hypothetical protein n=1 Tax=Salinarchaeum sp. IM2453 TaxID=2862870 RepID=UPI001C82D8CB|nr:hypothetical protein [Salinarchaeum sp. IM2453]QZA87857.1 hypothetical protein K0C01_08610 [Salinarchaeum sp. IM2453]